MLYLDIEASTPLRRLHAIASPHCLRISRLMERWPPHLDYDIKPSWTAKAAVRRTTVVGAA
jgi:hypothetical protein